jgi:hypothetical protein
MSYQILKEIIDNYVNELAIRGNSIFDISHLGIEIGHEGVGIPVNEGSFRDLVTNDGTTRSRFRSHGARGMGVRACRRTRNAGNCVKVPNGSMRFGRHFLILLYPSEGYSTASEGIGNLQNAKIKSALNPINGDVDFICFGGGD